MASLQCSRPAEQSQHQKHDNQQNHCFGGHVSDKFKGVFKGHHLGHGHGQAPPAPAANNANCGQCKPGPKMREHHKNKEGGLLHKIKEAFSDDSSDSDDDGHKAHHKRKN